MIFIGCRKRQEQLALIVQVMPYFQCRLYIFLMQNSEQTMQSILKRKSSQLSQLGQIPLIYKYSAYSNASSIGQCGQQQYNLFQSKFVRDDQLYMDILDKLVDIKAMTDMEDGDLCLYLLWRYQWNIEVFTQNYFGDGWEGVVAKQHVKHTVKQQQCRICYRIKEVYSTGMCQHAYCKQCWSNHIRSQLQNGYVFCTCMHDPACKRAPVLTRFIKQITPELQQLNRKKICQNYAIINKDISYCPNTTCPYFYAKDNMKQVRTVTCLCGQLYCFKCNAQAHDPLTCQQVKSWNKIINSQQINNTWIKNNTQQCPKCRFNIQKKVGCAHMRCVNCQCQFCYQCNGVWDGGHVDNKNQCPNKGSMVRHRETSSAGELSDYLIELSRQYQKNSGVLHKCQEMLKEGCLREWLKELAEQVRRAWLQMKWIKIGLFLQGKEQIQADLQKNYLQSIRAVMHSVQSLGKQYSKTSLIQLNQSQSKIIQQRAFMKKNVNLWLQCWEQTNNVFP